MMEISLALATDSHNTYPTDELKIRRGVNRPDNAVINVGGRQVEVDFDQLHRAVVALQSRGDA